MKRRNLKRFIYETFSYEQECGNPLGSRFCYGTAGDKNHGNKNEQLFSLVLPTSLLLSLCVCAPVLAVEEDQTMPEARRREVDVLLRGLAPKHQRQLSVSTSNALERFAVLEVGRNKEKHHTANCCCLLVFLCVFSSFSCTSFHRLPYSHHIITNDPCEINAELLRSSHCDPVDRLTESWLASRRCAEGSSSSALEPP